MKIIQHHDVVSSQYASEVSKLSISPTLYTTVWSALLYGCEAWTLSSVMMKQLDVYVFVVMRIRIE